MRWRIAIAVLAVLGIAGAVYLGTQPKKGTVEWHKKKLVQAESVIPPKKERATLHRNALVEAGYLVRRTVTVPSNPLPLAVYGEIRQILSKVEPANYDSFVAEEGDGTNWIVTAPADAIDAIAEVLRRGGGPETK
jgi:hypothetical protein